MFELSVARKYLAPRWRQLSVSIISLISILVIALVVWLIVVFFSVTNGLEKGWVQKLIALTAPIRVTPTQAYYDSHYFLVDSISANSDYATKSIREKLEAASSDPYDPNSDEEPPANWKEPVYNADGSLKDIVKDTFAAIQTVDGVTAKDFEVTMSNLKLKMVRTGGNQQTQAVITQSTYLGSIDLQNPSLQQTLRPITAEDFSNSLYMLSLSADDDVGYAGPKSLQANLQSFFNTATITELKPKQAAWSLPRNLIPEQAVFQAILLKDGKILLTNQLPKGSKILKLEKRDGQVFVDDVSLAAGIDIVTDIPAISATVVEKSLETAKRLTDIQFEVAFKLQGVPVKGVLSYGNDLTIAQAQLKNAEPVWKQTSGDGILVPKAFKESGVLVGDRGYISYYTPTTSSVQEQRLPIYVAGFYDPGIISIGGKFILADPEIVSLIRSAHQQDQTTYSNGINVRFDDLEKADTVKAALLAALKKAGVEQYWTVETYKEYDFTKDLLEQLKSDKTLFTLISTIIIIVACSNIISMLIIMVNDKKTEIGILRSMGASCGSIAAIFGICGIVMGMLGSLIGTFTAYITLKNLDSLILALNSLQGHNAFNPVFYGDTLPNEISYEALVFVVAATTAISLIAGIVPAIKASLLRPSAILRSE